MPDMGTVEVGAKGRRSVCPARDSDKGRMPPAGARSAAEGIAARTQSPDGAARNKSRIYVRITLGRLGCLPSCRPATAGSWGGFSSRDTSHASLHGPTSRSRPDNRRPKSALQRQNRPGSTARQPASGDCRSASQDNPDARAPAASRCAKCRCRARISARDACFIFSCSSGAVTSPKNTSSNRATSRRISARALALPRISGALSIVSSKYSQIAWLSISTCRAAAHQHRRAPSRIEGIKAVICCSTDPRGAARRPRLSRSTQGAPCG